MHLAAIVGDVLSIRAMIESGKNINQLNNKGQTLLDLTVLNNQLEASLELINDGADIYVHDAKNNTPMVVAIANRSISFVSLLINYGIDVNIKDRNGDTPLHIAVKHYDHPNCHYNLFTIVNTISFMQSPSHRYLLTPYHPPKNAEKSLEIIKLLIDNGADINAQNNEGATPLFLAITWDDPKLVKLLVDAKADVNIHNNDGYSILEIANKYHQDAIVELLHKSYIVSDT